MEIDDAIRHTTPLAAALVLAFGSVALSGCEEEADEVIELTHREEYEEAEAVSVAEPGEQQGVSPAPERGIGGETCMRARLCCQELVATMAQHSEEVTVDTPDGCAEVVPEGAEDPESACEDAIQQWAQALQAANVEVPAHCTESG